MRTRPAPVEAAPARSASVRASDLVGRGALIVAPHPDDEVLGCGGLIASAEHPDAIRVLVATDGARSPPGAAGDADLASIRRAESREALASLGIVEEGVSFAELPDGELRDLPAPLDAALAAAVSRAGASDVFVPFRFDRHPDHMAVHAAGERLARRTGVRLWEYFVYPRWRLLRHGDIRRHLRRESLVTLDLDAAARAAKRTALTAYRSQTTRFAAGQARPILGVAFLDELCARPEMFLRYESSRPSGAVLRGGGLWFAAVRRIEPPLKRARDALLERLSAGAERGAAERGPPSAER